MFEPLESHTLCLYSYPRLFGGSLTFYDSLAIRLMTQLSIAVFRGGTVFIRGDVECLSMQFLGYTYAVMDTYAVMAIWTSELKSNKKVVTSVNLGFRTFVSCYLAQLSGPVYTGAP